MSNLYELKTINLKLKILFISISVFSVVLITGCTESKKEVDSANKPKTLQHESQKQIPPTRKQGDNGNVTSSKQTNKFYQINLIDNNKGWAISNNNILVKNNNQKWLDVTPSKLISLKANYLSLFSFNENIAWVAGGDTILKTQDDGKTWKTIQIPSSNEANKTTGVDFSFINSQTGWMLAHRGYANGHSPFDIYQTTDGGTSWELKNHVGYGTDNSNSIPDTKDPQNITFVDEKHGFITGKGNDPKEITFYKTKDSGKTWSLLNISLPSNLSDGIIGFRAPQFFNQNEGMIQVEIETMNNKFFTILYNSNDQGENWKELYKMNGTGAVIFLNKKIGWANIKTSINDTSSSTIFKTTDGGNTWEKISKLNFSLNKLKFFNSQNGWGINEKTGQLMRSIDGGVTWKATS